MFVKMPQRDEFTCAARFAYYARSDGSGERAEREVEEFSGFGVLLGIGDRVREAESDFGTMRAESDGH